MNNQYSGVMPQLTKERRQKRRMRRFKDDLKSYVFLLPFIVGALVFTAYPIIMSLLFSFSDWNGGGATEMGVFNYVELFTRGATGKFDFMIHSFGITFLFTIASTVVNLVLSYVFAQQNKRNTRDSRSVLSALLNTGTCKHVSVERRISVCNAEPFAPLSGVGTV